MSLKSYFPDQFEKIKDFMLSAGEPVRCLRIDPEMRPMFTKALARMEDDDQFPHALIAYTDPFKDPNSYFEGLYDLLSTQCAQNETALKEQGVVFKRSFDRKKLPSPPFRFLRSADALAESLPDQVGSLVFLLDPEEVADLEGYRRSITFLAEKTKSSWLKFLVLDARTAPAIELPEGGQKGIGEQTFYLSPEEIERRTKAALETPEALLPLERRQYTGLLAGFAFARKEYGEAEALQRQWLVEAEEGGAEPSETAAALYNLGNTLMEKGEHEEATDVYCRACDLCVEKNLTTLAPMIYVNLGICLYRQGDFKQAAASLKVGRDMFKAQNMRPSEAYVVDALARIYLEEGERGKAEEAWRYALSLYDGITASHFADVREAGRADILEKLKRLSSAAAQDSGADPAEAEEGSTSHG